MESKHCKYLILGGGVTGLSFANFSKDEDYLIFDQDSELGGFCKTIKQDGFVWDYSGHFFHFSKDFVKKLFLEKIKDAEIFTVKKRTKVFYKKKLIDFPFQKNIHQLDKEEFIDCLHDLYLKSKDEPKNFLEMLYTKFGKSITEKFLKPYNEKLYSCDLNSLDMDAMGRFFPYANVDDIIKNFKQADNSSYNSTFIYPRNGAFEFIKSLLVDVKPERVFTDHRVKHIDTNDKTVIFENDLRVTYEHLISSIPFPKLLDLCNVNFDKSKYTSNKVLVFNMGFDKPTDIKDHWIYFSDKSLSFYRVGFYNNIIDEDRMSLYVEIGLKTEDVVDISSLEKIVLMDLKRCGIIQDQTLISRHNVIMNPAYVHITKESINDFKCKIQTLNKKDVYSIGRYGGWKYCSIEDNVVESKEIYELIGERND
jgi:protoporphyrinogen oxidase|tara:strand:+ start:330 stop:1595 length:1266 start_codon:yes stop_codon:yes gene_type:complete